MYLILPNKDKTCSMSEDGVFATNQDVSGHRQIISVNAGQWIISLPAGYLQTITLKADNTSIPGVISFFIWHLLQVPFVDC